MCQCLLSSGQGEGRTKKTANMQKDLLNVQKQKETNQAPIRDQTFTLTAQKKKKGGQSLCLIACHITKPSITQAERLIRRCVMLTMSL